MRSPLASQTASYASQIAFSSIPERMTFMLARYTAFSSVMSDLTLP